jgi:hypothetical protein
MKWEGKAKQLETWDNVWDVNKMKSKTTFARGT